MPLHDDIPGTRHVIEQIATKFNVYFFLSNAALLGSAMFIAGLIQWLAIAPDSLDSVPEPMLLIAIGFMCFSLFFPWFMTIYIARHLLRSVQRLEQDNAELRLQVSALSCDVT